MTTVGSYLATRLAQIGIERHFVVPGDYNLILLDKLQEDPGLDEINCTNELNCSMAAEGYARAKGAAACVVTYSVGAFSAFNGIGSAYGENLPVILISGCPNTNDAGDFNILHHTIGTHDFEYQLEMAKKITVAAVSIRRAADAPHLIDSTIRQALLNKKPVYIEIPTNLANQPCVPPGPESAILESVKSDPLVLKEAVHQAARFLSHKIKITILVGPKVRSAQAEDAVLHLAEALGCAVVVMPSAKSFFPETHPQYAGVYWGLASTLGAQPIVDWSDGVICIGTVFTDYSTVGWTAQPPESARLTADVDRVQLPGADCSRVYLTEFLSELSHHVKKTPATMVQYKRFTPPEPIVTPSPATDQLSRKEMTRQISGLITSKTTLFAETGDSWFNGIQMHLPEGARFEIEMQWGHIGWSIPASFGYAVGRPQSQVLTMVGDGSFQMTAQEVSQLTRLRIPMIIFLINNIGYTIEVEIHDGIYNNIKNWDYAAFVESFNANDGHGRGFRATTAGELHAAIESAKKNRNGPSLIECVIDRDDCTKELISWGHFVAAANGRAPRP
ncbi:hypothetical protein N7517_010242 [Penicillium concentricum]|uniref:Pyruvate decarboxylase n=1 Tax=Penicillium concentricum TaxID=293559 RepID=A0A9W9RDP9_9EURO|nr:uncharacterized protein N7517_010242 [Penicillium concentricum]KAJ5355633.1 hypothetical protein N7517_010242 [Penicillium concentricum]